MPNYLLVSIELKKILIFIGFLFLCFESDGLLAQKYEDRKFVTDKNAIQKMANQKTETLNKEVKLNESQKKKIRKLYFVEISKIDSLKYQPKEFFEDAERVRNIIFYLKNETQEKIDAMLTIEQRKMRKMAKELNKKKAIEKLYSEKK